MKKQKQFRNENEKPKTISRLKKSENNMKSIKTSQKNVTAPKLPLNWPLYARFSPE